MPLHSPQPRHCAQMHPLKLGKPFCFEFHLTSGLPYVVYFLCTTGISIPVFSDLLIFLLYIPSFVNSLLHGLFVGCLNHWDYLHFILIIRLISLIASLSSYFMFSSSPFYLTFTSFFLFMIWTIFLFHIFPVQSGFKQYLYLISE